MVAGAGAVAAVVAVGAAVAGAGAAAAGVGAAVAGVIGVAAVCDPVGDPVGAAGSLTFAAKYTAISIKGPIFSVTFLTKLSMSASAVAATA